MCADLLPAPKRASEMTDATSMSAFEEATTLQPHRPNQTRARGRETARLTAIEGVAAPAPRRVVSIDALRGFSFIGILGGDGIAWSLGEMFDGKDNILGDAGAFVRRQFSHVEWEGFCFYDLIFPLFIFITGVSIVFSLTRLVEREGRRAAHLRVLRRSFLLFGLGVLYYGGMSRHWPDIRLLGVLQRIALCYLFASSLFLNFRWRGLILAFIFLEAGYWALMTFVPVPGVGTGSYAMDANLANWIDVNYLPGMKWNGSRDPEGLLSTLPAIGSCLLGVLAGLLLQERSVAPRRKPLWLIGAGVLMVAAGYLLALQFPIIKQIWTSSFVLVAGGYSAILLGVFYQIIDVWEWRRWSTVFVWIGTNAIALYMLGNVMNYYETIATRFVGGDVADFFDSYVTPGTGHLLAAAGGLALAICAANYLYRNKIFLRI
jgi:predicted acyltransferase